MRINLISVNKFRHNASNYLATALFTFYSVITLSLFYVVFSSSFKTNGELFSNLWGFPRSFGFANYQTVFEAEYFRYLFNSLVVVLSSIFLILFISALASYGLGRFKFRGSRFLSNYFLLGLMFPGQLGIVPVFMLIRGLGLNNSLVGIIILYSAGVSMPIFIFTNFLKNIPMSISESAKIDGANEFTIFTRIILPMMGPVIGAMIPLTAIGLWNDLFTPLVFLTKESIQTLPIWQLQFTRGRYFSFDKLNIVFTAVTLSILPMAVLFVVGSRQMITGITAGAIKQ